MKAYKMTCPDCKHDDVTDWGSEYTCAACGYGWSADTEAERQATWNECQAWAALDVAAASEDEVISL